MQVKPRFEYYKILEQYPVLKDDTSNEMCLTLMEVKLPNCESEIIETNYKFWTIIGKKQETYNNKAVGYSDVAFWKEKKKDNLFKDIINGIEIEEIENGKHAIFNKNWMKNEDMDNYGLRTTFKIKKVKNE